MERDYWASPMSRKPLADTSHHSTEGFLLNPEPPNVWLRIDAGVYKKLEPSQGIISLGIEALDCSACFPCLFIK